MAIFKSLLQSRVLDIFRGYLRGIFLDGRDGFVARSTNFCLYRQAPDALSHSIKDLVVHILNEELERAGRREVANVSDLSLTDLITDYYLSLNVPKLPLETLINSEFERIFRDGQSQPDHFIILEVPRCFRPSYLSPKASAADGVEEDHLESDDERREQVPHFGVFNTTTSDASEELEESVYRVLKRFIERTMMEERCNTHLIMLSPYLKPPQLLLGKGMFEIYLPIEWEASKSNLTQLIKEVFEGSDIGNDSIEMIIASISYQDNAFSNLVELCYELKHFVATRYIGGRILKGERPEPEGILSISSQDVAEFLQDYNSKKLASYYSSSIDSLISTKISIDRDFVGLKDLRRSIKQSISALEEFNEHSKSEMNDFETYGYPISWLLWGNSGSGKSTLVRSMVSISPKIKVLFCSAIDLISPLHGMTTRNLRRIFQNAINSRPCILVFDDVETLGAFPREEDCSEGEVRSKINKELMSTLLYLLDSVISMNQDQALDHDAFTLKNLNLVGEFEETNDQLNFSISRKVAGLMIVMTTRSSMSSFPPELLAKVQRHSFLQLPSVDELLESIQGEDNPKISTTALQVAEDIQRLGGERLINVSEFKILVQNKLYEEYVSSSQL
ncbi:AAA ATPase-like protein [Cryptosporidium canis]|uniref:AAA ATPase-like protein n=1 Tax=Cryptosporidium canis TaxID=195482 RepID=A0ABQ8P332_9CRYT|nr:AAA ATPase-like protein [Cryptosporidium canis]